MVKVWNNVKTALLLGGLMGVCIGVGGIWGQQGLLIGLIFGGVMNIIAFLFSDKIAVAAMGGQRVDAATGTGGRLYQIVEELSGRAGLPMPKVYVCPQEAPNAFATGPWPSRGAVAVTQGALRLLDEEELRGVVAHELAHIRNRDTLTSTVAATISGVLASLAQMTLWFGGRNDRDSNPLVVILGTIAAAVGAALIQAAISRSREFVADADGARIAGTPVGLASALTKLEAYAQRIPMDNPNPAANSMFIVEPFMGSSIFRLFASHPSTEARIQALLRG